MGAGGALAWPALATGGAADGVGADAGPLLAAVRHNGQREPVNAIPHFKQVANGDLLDGRLSRKPAATRPSIEPAAPLILPSASESTGERPAGQPWSWRQGGVRQS